ncbi:MAG: mannitol dehydrogenase family protein, partial [Ruminococcus sp.]|nr:mannitol dehydrogenase family protein [Ruminococcus sp.]
PNDFLDTVINIRLPNPFLPDSPQRIASDTSQKLSVRFSETVKFYLDSGNEKSLKIIPLVYAGWLRYLLAKDDELESFALSSDPLSDYLKDFSCGITVGENYTEEFLKNHYRKLLSDEKIFGIDLTETSLFDKILAFLSMMLRGKNAVRETIKYVLSEEHI